MFTNCCYREVSKKTLFEYKINFTEIRSTYLTHFKTLRLGNRNRKTSLHSFLEKNASKKEKWFVFFFFSIRTR